MELHHQAAAAVSITSRLLFRVSLAERYPSVYSPWLGFARRIIAECYFKMRRIEEALDEARLAAEIWNKVATIRPSHESTQIAKTYLVLMQCEVASHHNEPAVAALERALNLLEIPLKINPKPLLPIVSDLINLALTIDPTAARLVPSELSGLLKPPQAN